MKINTDSPVFLIGMPRSGTTIMSEAISCHEELGWLSNIQNHFPSSYYISAINRLVDNDSIGISLRSKKNKAKGIRKALLKPLPFLSEAHYIWHHYCGERFASEYLIDERVTKKQKLKFLIFINNILKIQEKERFFHKFTGPSRITYLNSIFPDAYFVHVIRDPRAVIASLINASFWVNGKGLEELWWKNGLPEKYLKIWVENNKSPVALAAIQWRWVVELAWREKQLINNNRYIEVYYEDFVSDPHRVLNNIFCYSNLKKSDRPHKYINSLSLLKSMNQKFEKQFSNEDITIINKICQETASKAGYTL